MNYQLHNNNDINNKEIYRAHSFGGTWKTHLLYAATFGE